MPCKNSLVLFSCSSPMLYGIYQGEELIASHCFEGKTLDGLVEILQRYPNIDRICYARGPGSFTAIKLTHIFLQTLKITQGVELLATESFYFNANAPIKAFGKQYFIKVGESIILQKLDSDSLPCFALPQKLKIEDFSSPTQPLYILPPI